MNSQYKKDEKIMKNIIRKNVKSADHNKDITPIIYYTAIEKSTTS